MYTTEYPSLLVRASVLTERPPPSEELPEQFPAPAVPHTTSTTIDTDTDTGVDPPALAAAAPDRSRDDRGHCWDGHPCDHSDHEGYEGYEGNGGPIHLMH